MKQTIPLILGSLMIATGIALDAYANHAAQSQKLVQTAGTYFIYGGLSAIVLTTSARLNSKLLWSAYAALSGCILFSGSILLKAEGLISSSTLAPLGGILLILSWISAAIFFAITKRA